MKDGVALFAKNKRKGKRRTQFDQALRRGGGEMKKYVFHNGCRLKIKEKEMGVCLPVRNVYTYLLTGVAPRLEKTRGEAICSGSK